MSSKEKTKAAKSTTKRSTAARTGRRAEKADEDKADEDKADEDKADEDRAAKTDEDKARVKLLSCVKMCFCVISIVFMLISEIVFLMDLMNFVFFMILMLF